MWIDLGNIAPMERNIDTKCHIFFYSTHEISRTCNPTETKRLVVARGKRAKGMGMNAYGVSFRGNENGLQFNNGDGYKTF